MSSGDVDAPRLLAWLEDVAARIGAEVRYESMDPAITRAGSGGGVVRLRGRTLILVDAALAPAERASVLVAALARFDLDGVWLPPAVRARIQAARPDAALSPRPLARTRAPRDDDDD